NRATLQ
nr:Chain B, ASN-ARG-ALA-THR-LEU-GLN [Severe acute respiratory syndrome coronavirus 2]